MIAVDTNILVYAHRKESRSHHQARECVREIAEGDASWAIPWQCIQEFLGVVTNPRIWQMPTPMGDAIRQVEIWMESPTLVLLSEGPEHWAALRAILAHSRVVGAKAHDARIAAICLQHGVTALWSADRDFSRFSGLHVINPIAS